MTSDQVDSRRRSHGQEHSGVAVVAVHEQEEGRDQADPDRHEPRDPRQRHSSILKVMPDRPRFSDFSAEAPHPEDAPRRLCELSVDARAAVLLDRGLQPAASTETDPDRGRRLAELARDLVEIVDASASQGPVVEIEAQVSGGSVYVVRRPDWTLAVVARRSALSSLMLCDMRFALSQLEGPA